MFKGNPRMVRYRKLRMLFFTIFVSITAAALVGLLYYAAYKLQR